MRIYDIIEKKKHGKELTEAELEFAVMGYVEGKIPDYQMSALLMAIYFRGMTDKETAALTGITAHSGDVLDLSCLGNGGELTADKHSTGGVGDKTTLVVAPIAAAAGAVVAKMSGRGLGHTGGTIDKLESIPGFRVNLSGDEFINTAKKTGISVISAGMELAPADKKLYALRDVTATVDSIPLIAASIMGKKLASGSKNIVLDVKYGSGAFMKTPEEAEALGEKMINIGRAWGRNMRAVITDMNVPLGRCVGNFSEVAEAYELLCGNTEGKEDLASVCIELAANMISLSLEMEIEKARELAREILYDGRGAEKFIEWIKEQGADTEEFFELLKTYKEKRRKLEVKAPRSGYIYAINTEKIGICALVLGAGRKDKDDTPDLLAGVEILKKTWDHAEEGETLACLYGADEEKLMQAKDEFLSALTITHETPAWKNEAEKRKKSEGVIYKTLQ